MKATTTGIVNLRRTPGFKEKPANDVQYEIPAGSEVTVLGGPQTVDGLTWWQVRFTSQFSNRFDGWLAATKASGEPLLTAGAAPTPSEPTTPPVTPPPSGKFQPGQRVYAAAPLNLRRTPGFSGKPANDVLTEAPQGAALSILAGPQQADNLPWWQVRATSGNAVAGWAAERSAAGAELLSTTAPAPPEPVGPLPTKTFAAGNVVVNAYTDALNVRRSPGYSGKDNATDIVAKLPGNAPVMIAEGPRQADDLQWWRIVGNVAGGAGAIDGWVAEVGPKGQRFLIPAQLAGKIKLAKPFEGKWRVTQLFGDRPEFYSKYSYDGVRLRGHNGVDFGTPNGTKLLATDDGEVVQVGYEANGFGHFAKLSHLWGDSVYAHMKEVTVKEGDKVKRGDVLGLSDNTGNSSGPHLHFGVRIFPNKRGDGWGGYTDPIPFMNPADVIIPDDVRAVGPELPPPGMAPDAPGYVRP